MIIRQGIGIRRKKIWRNCSCDKIITKDDLERKRKRERERQGERMRERETGINRRREKGERRKKKMRL